MKRASLSMEMRIISQKAAGNLPKALKSRCSPPSTPFSSSPAYAYEVMTILTSPFPYLSLILLFDFPTFDLSLCSELELIKADSCIILYCLSLLRSM